MSGIQDTNDHLRKATARKSVFALLAIAVGAIWFLKNLGVIDADWTRYLVSWKALLIGVGLIGWAGDRNGSIGYLIMIFAGAFWLFYDIFNWNIDVWNLFLPAMLILIGIAVLLKAGDRGRQFKKNISSTDILDSVAIFGASEVRVTSQQFAGGRSTAIFGGSEVDLSNAELAEGEHVIEIFNLFGGSTIVVPPHWSIKMEVTGILGAFSDSRKNFVHHGTEQSDRVLVIRGAAILGGGEVKSF